MTLLKRPVSLAAALLGAALLLAGCGGGEDPVTEVEPVTNPSPDAGQSKELLVALGAIDPALNEGGSVSSARDMCDSILKEAAGEPHPQYSLVELAQTRFSSVDLTEEQAQQVIDAINAGGWCQ